MRHELNFLIMFSIVLFFARTSQAVTINAASCSNSAVTDAYVAAVDGDTISIPAGVCTWTSSLTIQKKITIQGAGAGSTTLRLGTDYTPIFYVRTDNVRITGFTFDGQYRSTSNSGGIVVGFLSDTCNSKTYHLGDFRIDHNKFIHFDTAGANGNNSISFFGFVYGVVDNNIFDDCTGECLNVCSDGVPNGILRSQEFGQYTDGTIYIEDNTWNYMQSYLAENAIDGNSASRWVMRYNTFNVGASSGGVNGLISNHETCATCSCDSRTEGDAGSLKMEIYGNKIYCGNNCPIFVVQRGGKSLIYNNTFYSTDTGSLVRLSNYRSFDYSNCDSAAHARGYSEWCHDPDGGYTVEGRESSKTILSGAVTADQTTIPLTSTSGFSTNGVASGFSIMIGSEQIDYTGISGNQLTGCKRGAGGTQKASHPSNAPVDYLKFGVCLEQINNTYIWNNRISGGADKNGVILWLNGASGGHNDYSTYDIQSYAQRPQNGQYRNDGTSYNYTPYPYPHPLTLINQTCVNADTNCNGCVEMTEIISYINLWKNTTSITLTQVIEAINLWKKGC